MDFTNTGNTFTGSVTLSSTAGGDEHFRFASLGDGGTFTFAKNGNRQLITYNGSSNITFNTRTITIATTMVNGGATDRQGMDGGGSNPVSLFANDSATGTVTFTQNMIVNNISSNYGILYFGGTNTGNNTFAGNIGDTSGTSQLSIGKFGAGKWILTGSNSYQGNTLIGGGTLSVGTIADANVPQPLGIGAGIQLGVSAAGTLEYTGSGASTNKQIVIGAPVNQNANTSAGSFLNNGSGALTFTNAIFNPTSASYIPPGGSTPTGTAITATRTLTLGGTYSGGSNEIQGVIQNNASGGVVNITLSGSTWVLSGTNTYTGATNVIAGSLGIGSDSAVGSGTLNIGGTNSNTPTIFASGAARTIVNNTVLLQSSLGGNPTVSGTQDLTLNGTTTASGAARTLSVNNAGITTLAGNVFLSNDNTTTGRGLTINGTGNVLISGTVANNNSGNTLAAGFTKAGSGTLTLTGTNTFTGATTLNAGTLLVNNPGSLAAVSAVGVNGGTFGGTGTVNGSITVNSGGTLAPGTATEIGTLTVAGPVTFISTSTNPTLAIKLGDPNSPSADLLAMTGTGAAGVLTIPGATTLNLLPQFAIGNTAATFTISTFDSETGTFGSVLVNGAPTQDTDPLTANYAMVTYNLNNIQVTVANVAPSVVPEPGTLLGLAAGALGLAGCVRRRWIKVVV